MQTKIQHVKFQNQPVKFLTVLGWRIFKARQCVFWHMTSNSIRFSLILKRFE